MYTDFQVYWEKQESGFCGVHCVNSLLQGAYFTEVDFAEIALELDRREKQLMTESGIDSTDFLKYMAEDSGRVNQGGNFSISVLRNSLDTMGLQVLNVASEDAKGVMDDPVGEVGFVCHLMNHWFSVRKLNNHWFNLNSIQSKPTYITPFFLSTYLQQLRMENYMIYVIKGNFPKIMQGGGDLSGRGKWCNAGPIIAAKGSIAISPKKTTQTSSTTSSSPVVDDDLARAIEASRKEEQERRRKMEEDEMEMVIDESELLQAKELSLQLSRQREEQEQEQKEMEMELEDPDLRFAIEESIRLNKKRQKKVENIIQEDEKMIEKKKEKDNDTNVVMDEGATQDTITIRIKFPPPSTKKIQDTFSLGDTIGKVVEKVIATDSSLSKSQFRLITSYPPVKRFENSDKTLKQLGISDRDCLIIEMVK